MKWKWGVKYCQVCPLSSFLDAATESIDKSVKVIENLSGHSINKYQIHGGKSVVLVKSDDQTKMEEGEYFAIETFGSTGRGRIVDEVRDVFDGKIRQCNYATCRENAPIMLVEWMHPMCLFGEWGVRQRQTEI